MKVFLCVYASLRLVFPDTVPPYVALPEPGLDDTAAYQGYQTRVYRDAAKNSFQVYIKARIGRVVNLWADALDESVGFSVRDSLGRPANITWASSGALPTATGTTRSMSYALAGPAPLTVGLFLLGSMRIERDFQYAGRDTLPVDSVAFHEWELAYLISDLEGLHAAQRRRDLAILGARTIADLRARLQPRVTLTPAPPHGSWTLRVTQTSFDGRHHLALELEGDAATTSVQVSGRTATIRSQQSGGVRLLVRVTTDAPALTPLDRRAIFNTAFLQYASRVAADTSRRLAGRLLEREIRGMELLASQEKLMAGLPNFATYFGRDMLMTALLMQSVWAPEMTEHVLASALAHLAPDGDVSHEEALGGQAIREHATEFHRSLAAHDTAAANRELAHLGETRQNYIMVDDDVQLPVVAARYLADDRIPATRKRQFLSQAGRLPRLLANLEFVARSGAAYAQHPVATNLRSFPRATDGHCISASWRDSRAGYAGGCFAMDVNVIWMPHALRALGTILDALHSLGLAEPGRGLTDPLAAFARDRASLEQAITAWRGAIQWFRVTLPPDSVTPLVQARLDWLPASERDFWAGATSAPAADTLRFLALSLDSAGRPIPVVNTDPAMLLLVDSLPPEAIHEIVDPILAPYPKGLFVPGLGPLVANDAYAPREVWEAFRADRYHSPYVVWGRDVNTLLVGLAAHIRASPPGADASQMKEAVGQILTAADASGLRHAELWSYRIEGGKLFPIRYGESSDVQLWSLTDLAAQYLLDQATP